MAVSKVVTIFCFQESFSKITSQGESGKLEMNIVIMRKLLQQTFRLDCISSLWLQPGALKRNVSLTSSKAQARKCNTSKRKTHLLTKLLHRAPTLYEVLEEAVLSLQVAWGKQPQVHDHIVWHTLVIEGIQELLDARWLLTKFNQVHELGEGGSSH